MISSVIIGLLVGVAFGLAAFAGLYALARAISR